MKNIVPALLIFGIAIIRIFLVNDPDLLDIGFVASSSLWLLTAGAYLYVIKIWLPRRRVN